MMFESFFFFFFKLNIGAIDSQTKRVQKKSLREQVKMAEWSMLRG